MKAPTGHYRKLISNPHIRIAFTHTPIYGCVIVDCTEVIEELRQSNDPYAQYYIDGLTSGNTVTIVEQSVEKHYRNNGELFFTS
jgi:hypothetical protein